MCSITVGLISLCLLHANAYQSSTYNQPPSHDFHHNSCLTLSSSFLHCPLPHSFARRHVFLSPPMSSSLLPCPPLSTLSPPLSPLYPSPTPIRHHILLSPLSPHPRYSLTSSSLPSPLPPLIRVPPPLHPSSPAHNPKPKQRVCPTPPCPARSSTRSSPRRRSRPPA